jgi:hypothetical protein
MTLKTPEPVAEQIVALCLPDFAETGRLYEYSDPQTSTSW